MSGGGLRRGNLLRVLAGRARWLRRWHGVVAAALAVVLAVSLAVAVPWPHGGGPGVPVQPMWGSAAGRSHRVPASATIERFAGGRLVPYPARWRRAPRPVLAVKNAVPPQRHPAKIAIRVIPRAGEQVRDPHLARPARVRGFDPRTSRAVPAQASADKIIYANRDGTRTAFVFQTPVNYRRADGSWALINTKLIPAGHGAGAAAWPAAPQPSGSLTQLRSSPSLPPPSASAAASSPSGGAPGAAPSSSPVPAGPAGWREASAAFPEVFAPFADAGRLVLLPVDASHQVAFGVAGAARAAGVARGATVIYPGARAGSDLRFIAGAGLAGEQIILRSAAAPASWVFPLALTGLTARMGPGGVVEFTDAAGRVRAAVAQGSMTDSNIDPHSGDGASSDGVRYALTTLAGRPAVRMTLDTSWLASPRRVFPVTVNVSVSSFSVSSFGSTGTTYIQNSDSSNHSGESEVHVGTWDGGADVTRGLLKFDVSSLNNDTVLGVRLSLFNSWSYSCSPRTLYVYPVNQSWSPSTVTWPGPSTGAAVGQKSFATGWVPLGSTVSPCPASWEAIDLGQAGTNLVDGWTHGAANNGLALGASSSDSYGWKKFTSKNNPTGDPFLAITYTPYGADYELASPRPVIPVTPTQNGQIALRVTNEGSATWPANGGSNGYRLSYRAYDSHGTLVADHPVFTSMPSDVAPGQTVTVNANVNALPAGSYALDFDMYAGSTSFSSQGVPPLAVGLYVPQPPPGIAGVYPPSGYLSPVNTPELSTTATGGTTYQFTLTCHPLPGTTCPGGSISSGQISQAYWTPPPLIWNEPYTWTVTVTNSGGSSTAGPVAITPEVPQPVVTSRLGGAAGQAFDPQTGDYTSSATDAAVAAPGPPLKISRTYNSLDPRTSGAFGAGWFSPLDMQVSPDTSAATSSVVVTMPDGSQARFGYGTGHADGSISYIPPFGSSDVLQQNSDGTWSLMVPGGVTYGFTSSGTISQITTPGGLAQTFTPNAAGRIKTITDAASRRALHLTWVTPPGSTSAHVATVTTDPPASGQPGLTWAYSYTGDKLTQVCNPDGNCTGYTYATSLSHFATAVMDAGPRSYYRLGDPAGDSTATDSVPVNLGASDGTYHNVTLGGAGPLAGSAATSASFDGTSSYAALASNLITDSTYLSVGLWFKATSGHSGVLFGYQSSPITAGIGGHWVPALYVGTDGKLRGEFWNGQVDPVTSTATVADGQWHYAVLTGAGTTQTLYLDGASLGTVSGTIDQQDNTYDYAGAGSWTPAWPGSSPANQHGYFNGSLAEVAIYQQALPPSVIGQQYALATASAPELTQITLPSGRIYEQASYDTVHDRASAYTDPNGGTWTLHLPVTTGYKANSEALGEATTAVTVADPAGRDEIYSYDAINGGRLTSYNRGAGNAPRTFGYDSAGCLNQVTDEDGNTLTLTNDAFCNVLARSWGDITGCPPSGTCTTYYGYYDNTANPLDPRNNQVTAIRDARSASPADNTYLTSYGYNTAGQLTSSTTPATPDFPSGRTTTYAYSTGSEPAYPCGTGTTIPAGLLLSATTPGGAVTSYNYCSNGDLAKVTEPSGRSTVYSYDNLGRPLTATVYTTSNPGGLQTSYGYDSTGQPLSVTYPGVTNTVTGVTHTLQDTYSYDTDGNLTSATQADLTGGDPSRTTGYTYDEHGQIATVTDPVATASQPGGATTAYTWDASGNLASMIDAAGNEWDYAYNEYNQITQVTLTASSTDQGNPGGGTSVVLTSYGYDPAGLLASVTVDPTGLGRITNYAYDPGERLIAVTQTNAATSPTTGRQTAYGYDNAGNLTSLTRNGLSGGLVTTSSVTTYTVDAAGRLSQQVLDPQVLDPSGLNRATSYNYDADNHPTVVTTTQGQGSSTTSDKYDPAGNLTRQTIHDTPANQVTTWTYDQNGLPLTMTGPRGNAAGGTPANYSTSYGYDQAGRLSSVTGPPVQVQTYAAQAPVTTQPVTGYGYDTYGDLTQQNDPDGNLSTAAYDGDGRLTSLTQPAYTPPGSSTPITATTSYGYDGLGRVTSTTDPAGNTTSYGYDALGDLTSRTDPQLTGQPAPGIWAWTYDNAGEPQSATDPTGGQTHYTWNYFGDLATVTQNIRDSSQPAGTSHYRYDYLDDLVKATSAAGVVTTSGYDAAGELSSTQDAYGNTTGYTYNQLGQLATLTRPDQTSVSYGYDPAGNLTSVTGYGAPPSPPALDSQAFGYDVAGNLTSATDGRGNTSTFGYNAANEITGETQPVSATSSINVSFGYDAASNQTAATDGRGNTTWTTYNPWNLPESVIEPATSATPQPGQRTYTTGYDADARPLTWSQPGGVTTTAGYDQIGDLTQLTGAGAEAATPTQTYGYDLAGRLTSATAPGGTDTFTWNDASNLVTTAGPSGASSFTYNADGQMATRADAAGTTSYTYDNAGRLATLTDPATSATLTYGYTPNSQPATISYATGTTQGPTRTLTYNPLQQLATDTLTTPSGATIASASYGYDPNGNLTSQTTTGYAAAGATTYGYDQANRLTSATTSGATTSYTNDASGNLTQAGATSYNYDARDQLTSSTDPTGGTSYTWTPRGTLNTITPPSGPAQTYTYNAFGQLTTAPGITSYGYDGLDRLATRTTSSATTTFAYTGAGTTLASDGKQTYTYTPGGTITGLINASGQGRSLLTNLHGDITGLFTPAGTNALLGSAAYTPYGTISAATGASSDLGYQGQWTDPHTGQTSMGARWYDPATGAFTSRDTWHNSPIPSPGNANPYAYADAGPLTNTDPTGHFCWSGSCLFNDLRGWSCALDWQCGLTSWFWNATPTASGCGVDIICPVDYQDFRGGWGGTGLDPRWTNFNQGGGGCGWACLPIGIIGAVSIIATPPPPPPPPPQDIYAGPDPANAPAAPRWMRTAPYVTQTPQDITNPADLLDHGPGIIEQPQPLPITPITGLGLLPNTTAKPFSADNNLTQQTFNEFAKPPFPAVPFPAQPHSGQSPGPAGVTLPAAAGNTPAATQGSSGSPPPGTPGIQLPLHFPDLPAQGSNITETSPPPAIATGSIGGKGGGNTPPPTATGGACEPEDNNPPAESGAPNPGGSRGSPAVRAQLDQIRDELLDANPDWVHEAGGTDRATGIDLPERRVLNPNDASQFRLPDLTFRLPDGSRFYVNTVDTYRFGSPNIREFEAAVDISLWGCGPVLMIPKP